jgi:hypothetical protein
MSHCPHPVPHVFLLEISELTCTCLVGKPLNEKRKYINAKDFKKLMTFYGI